MSRTFSALAVVALLAGGAWGLTPGEQRCQDVIAATGRRVLGRSLAILAHCQRQVARGERAAGTDCLTDAATTQLRAAAVSQPLERLAAVCGDGDVAAISPAGDCSGVTDVAALSTCMRAGHGFAAENLTAITGAGRALLPAAARACATQTSRQVRRFTLARLRIIHQCKHLPPRRRLLPGVDCGEDARSANWIAQLRWRATAAIEAECDSAAIAAVSFGAPCDREVTSAGLADCLLSSAAATGDRVVAAQFADLGFCGEATEAVEQRVAALIADMTVAEKSDQMHGSGLLSPYRTRRNERLGIPGISMIDGPRGVSTSLGPATAFPVAMARGATWDPELEERIGEAIGTEARAKGVSMILAPTINIVRHPRWGRAQETYGEDTFHIGRMGVGFVRGAQQHVIANPKHFAGNSIEDTRFDVDVSIDERTLREIYLRHFEKTVRDGDCGAVMSAYNKVNGAYCSENPHLLRDILKDEWGFRGFVESDWIFGTRSTVPAVTAGLDIEMPTGRFLGRALIDAVAAGEVDESLLDGAVRHILRTQLCFRLDTDQPVEDPAQIESAAHIALALEAAQKSLVLLKNTDAGLPFDRSQMQSIVVVGPLAAVANLGDTGSSSVTPSYAVAPLDGIRAYAGGGEVTYISGPVFTPSDEALLAAADAVVAVAGLTFEDEGEDTVGAGDRQDLILPGTQNAMIASVAGLNPRTVVVLEGSGPITMPWLDDVAAVVMAWYPGLEGGNAIGSVLFGAVTPSGKLPLTFPRAEADLPPFDNVSLAVTYDYFHGYRYLDHNGVEPLFPFGFGLSYTTFNFAHLSITPTVLSPYGHLRVTADVTNTGTVAGDEVVQLYVGYSNSRVVRAEKDLKGFARVHLEPGETRTVLLDVAAADLAFWDVDVDKWEVEPIAYSLHLGSSSRDLPLSGTFTITP